MQQPWYATREQVKRALDSAETARNDAQVDRAIASASRSVESQMHRKFYPWDGTKYFGFRPWVDGNSSWRMWLNENDLVSVTALTVGADTISASDYFLEPVNSGPPYRYLEMDLSSNAVLQSNDTWQRAVAVTGTWGYWEELETVGTLVDDLDADVLDTATIAWTDQTGVGVGSILKIDSERMIVSGVSFVDTTDNLGVALDASAAAVTVTVADSSGFYVGEVIRVDSERMLVVDIGTATTVTVKRAWDGSVLAAHLINADIYGKTGVSLDRAQLGTTLAAHTALDVVYRYVVPAGINDLTVAEALVQLQGEQSAYARAGGGAGESSFGTPGTGLAQLRKLTVGGVWSQGKDVCDLMAGNSYVTMSGPMFDGRAVAATHAFVHAAVDAVGQEAEDLVRQGTGVFKHPTGHYESMISIRVSGETALVTDSNAVYGPWLEGVGSRNATTRFKGYHFWRKAGQQAQRRAQPIASRVLSRFIGRMQ